MKSKFAPSSKIGVAATALSGLCILLVALKYILPRFHQSISLSMQQVSILGILGFLLGIVAILKMKDKSVLTISSVVFGALIIIWIIAGYLF